MHPYTAADTLRIAKRYNNPKRSYLLVNPLQAKHIPVSPAAALEMMGALGDQVAAKYPEARLVIGFAETATAIGAAVAARLGPDCLYVHTTREALDGDWILFREEHSHAAEHRLCADQLADWIDRSPAIVFVDDEFSTGRTLINMVQQLRERYPRLGERRLAAASILSRVSPENQARLAEAGIACECLVRLEHQDYERMVTGIPVKEAAPPAQGPLPDLRTLYTAEPLPDPRRGVAVGCYTDCCRAAAEELLSRLREELPDQGALLVLGTEECMYPALTVGSLAEQTGLCATVRCHATTRSPIGICPDSAYPIRNGVLLPSFYGGDRKTYLYDLAAYDAALVVTDAPAAVDGAAPAKRGAPAALAAITDPNTGVADRSKIALAISFTSVGLKLDKDGKLAETTIYSPAPDTIVGRLRQSDTVRGWDDTAATPYADYTAEGDRYRLWYEDARSVSAKMQLARMFGVGGVSLWRLGTIPNYGDAGLDYDVWSAVLAAE